MDDTIHSRGSHREHCGHTLVGQTHETRCTAVNEIARIEIALFECVRAWGGWKKHGERVNSPWITVAREMKKKKFHLSSMCAAFRGQRASTGRDRIANLALLVDNALSRGEQARETSKHVERGQMLGWVVSENNKSDGGRERASSSAESTASEKQIWKRSHISKAEFEQTEIPAGNTFCPPRQRSTSLC